MLAEKKVEAFVKIGDYATIQGFGSITKVGLERKIPVFSVDADDIKLPGCLATIGWAYFDDGYAAGKLAVRVLKGESPAKMAFEPLTKTELLVNRTKVNDWSNAEEEFVKLNKEGDKAKMLPVKRGISDDSHYEILEGVSEGQEIVTGSFKAVSKELNDGSLIQLEEPKKDKAAKP